MSPKKKMAPNGSGGSGNTKDPPIRINGALHWSWTLNNYTEEEIEDILSIIASGSGAVAVDKYLFQTEIGEECGTPHLQGYFKFKSKARPMETFKNHRFKWLVTRNPDAWIKYCSKEKTFTGRRWTNIKLPKPLKLINPSQFYPWQKDIIDIIMKEPDDRTIYWFWEEKGGVGKTQFCKYLCAMHSACIMSGKATDCKHGIVKYHEERKDYPELVIFDIPRCNKDFISFDAIESIKNGLFFSGKYEGCQAVFNCPHVICFANEPPEESKLSLDRWQITYIS